MKKFSIFDEMKNLRKNFETAKSIHDRQEKEMEQRRQTLIDECKKTEKRIKDVDDFIQRTKQ